MRPNILFNKLRAGEVAIGINNSYPAPGIVECMAKGWDWLWIDGQHGQMSVEAAHHACLAAATIGIETLIRVPGHEFGIIGPFIDLCPSAVMIPMVNNPEHANAVVKATRFPPLGMRSYGGRRVIDVDGRDYYRERELLVVAQVETVESVTNADAIINTPGIDALFFGPDDMKVQMGIPVNTAVTDNDKIRQAMKTTADAARKAGKFAGCVGVNAASAKMAHELGYQLIVGGGDVMFLRTLAAEKLTEIRNAVSGKTAVPPGNKPAETGMYGGR